MHVLTKIFVVLVSLLAVLLVPLVVVYSHNEDSYKAKYLEAKDQVAAARAELTSAQANFGAETAQLRSEIQEAASANRDAVSDSNRYQGEVSQLEARLAAAESLKMEIESKLATLSSSLATSQQTVSTLLDETRKLRQDALQAEQRRAELDEQLRDVQGQLDVAIAARRMLQEELQKLRNDHASALTQVSMFVAKYGDLGETTAADGIAPDRNVTATVIGVERNSVRTLVEIDAGSTSGVREGWILTVGADGGTFIGTLRITEVDINRSVGVLSLENPAERGEVKIGHQAYARAGQR